jgi:redox-sensing transcriptional repressor
MNKISKAVISRLPRYYRYLDELRAQKIERISSKELSKMMNVTASQIRQDLNNFGGFGQQGYGYNVQYLYDEISKLLGLDVPHKMVIVGAGNLGQAIANYGNFKNRGFEITALFDKNPELIGKKTVDAEILDIEYLYDYVKENNVEIVALTLPKEPARKVAEKFIRYGI